MLDLAAQDQARRALPHLLVRPRERLGVLPGRRPEQAGDRSRARRSARPAGDAPSSSSTPTAPLNAFFGSIPQLMPSARRTRRRRCGRSCSPTCAARSPRRIALGDDGHMQSARASTTRSSAPRSPRTTAARSNTRATGSWPRSRRSSSAVAFAVEVQRRLARPQRERRRAARREHRDQRGRAGHRRRRRSVRRGGATRGAPLRARDPPAISRCRSRCASSASASPSGSTTAVPRAEGPAGADADVRRHLAR